MKECRLQGEFHEVHLTPYQFTKKYAGFARFQVFVSANRGELRMGLVEHRIVDGCPAVK